MARGGAAAAAAARLLVVVAAGGGEGGVVDLAAARRDQLDALKQPCSLETDAAESAWVRAESGLLLSPPRPNAD